MEVKFWIPKGPAGSDLDVPSVPLEEAAKADRVVIGLTMPRAERGYLPIQAEWFAPTQTSSGAYGIMLPEQLTGSVADTLQDVATLAEMLRHVNMAVERLNLLHGNSRSLPS